MRRCGGNSSLPVEDYPSWAVPDGGVPLFFDRLPKGKWSFRFRFLTSSSTMDESVDGGVSAIARPNGSTAEPPATVPPTTAAEDSLLDVEVEVVDSWCTSLLPEEEDTIPEEFENSSTLPGVVAADEETTPTAGIWDSMGTTSVLCARLNWPPLRLQERRE